jgi:ribosomal protein L15
MGGREVILERVVERTAAAVVYPMLTRTNYTEWSLVMKVNLQAAGLWEIIETGEGEYRDDRAALAALLRAVPQDMHTGLATKETAKEAWEAIREVRVGVERVKEANAEQLRREFSNLRFKPGESVEEFSLRLNTLAHQLRSLGDMVTEKEVVKRLLHSVPESLEQVAISIETLLDLSKISIEEATGRLRAVEQRKKPAPVRDDAGRLLLTEEEWRVRLNNQEARGSSSSGGRGGSSRGRGRGGGRGRGDSHARSHKGKGEPSNKFGPKPDDVCNRCGKKGHWARECRRREKEKEAAAAANLVQEEEEALLMVAAAEEEVVRDVQLREEKVFAQLDEGGVRDVRSWVLDTGATNHMSGSRAAFAELDMNVVGSVRFGDSSTAKIEGCGTILFVCKTGEHKILSNVYYIPRLTTNIVSVGQLDETGHEVVIKDGVMKVWDPSGVLLAHAPRKGNRLFVLDIPVTQPVCLASCTEDEAWRWHARFGHLNFQALRTLARRGMVRGLPLLSHVNQLCEGCMAGKQRRLSFPQKAEFRVEEVLDLVHGDLCGPISPPTAGGSKYFLLMVDDRSRFMWVSILRSKDQAADSVKQFKLAAEAETGRKLRMLRTDRGGEFTSVEFMEFCAEVGMQRQLTAPYSPQQNGVVERRNATVVATTRSLLKAKNLPGWL